MTQGLQTENTNNAVSVEDEVPGIGYNADSFRRVDVPLLC